mgnify:CR=1 FL=1
MGRLGDGENQKLHVCTIRHGYVDTLKKLGFGSRSNDLSEWMPAARILLCGLKLLKIDSGYNPVRM